MLPHPSNVWYLLSVSGSSNAKFQGKILTFLARNLSEHIVEAAYQTSLCRRRIARRGCSNRFGQLSFPESPGDTEMMLRTYKYPTKVLSVDIDADWKAEQVVEPSNDMHSCAIVATGAERSDNSNVLVLRCQEPFLVHRESIFSGG